MIVDEQIRNEFTYSDILVGNLEGPETDSENRIDKAGPSLRQTLGTIKFLAKLGFNYLALANNHIMDYGKKGLIDTINLCKKNNISYSGVGDTLIKSLQPVRIIKNNIRISIFSFAETEFGAASQNNIGYAPIQRLEIDNVIKNEKKISDFIIVCAHGGIEEVPLPNNNIIERYRHLADLGVNLIIGTHPHTPQGYEKRHNCWIFYSLGNFIANSNQWSYIIKIIAQKNNVKKINIIPININKNKVSLIRNSDNESCNKFLKLLSSYFLRINTFKSLYSYQIIYLFNNRYLHYLKNIFSFYHPNRIIRLLNKAGFSFYKKEFNLSKHQQLLLLLLLSNESHRTVLENIIKTDRKELI